MTLYSLDLYNEFVDHRAWDSTTTWLSELFGGDKYDGSNEPDSFNVIPIDYEDVEGNNTVQLRGDLSLPENTIHDGPLPLVVVFPGGSGDADYEKSVLRCLQTWDTLHLLLIFMVQSPRIYQMIRNSN